MGYNLPAAEQPVGQPGEEGDEAGINDNPEDKLFRSFIKWNWSVTVPQHIDCCDDAGKQDDKHGRGGNEVELPEEHAGRCTAR